MRRLLTKLRRDCRGGAAVELALTAPILMGILAGITEIGYMFYQASALERGLRAGATFAARADLPLSAADKATTENLVKTASVDGTLGFSTENWGEDGATLNINVVDRNVGSVTVSVIQITARLPYSPISDALWSFVGLPTDFIEVSHEQASLSL